jgi:hypothetical protein
MLLHQSRYDFTYVLLHPVLIETANTADHIRHALLAFTSRSATRDEVVHPCPASGS